MKDYVSDEEIRCEIKEEAKLIKQSRKKIKKLKKILRERNNSFVRRTKRALSGY